MREKIHFEKLTPTSEIELKIYKDAFDKSFSDNDIRNIALSGSYGAGKSSLVEAYKSQSQKKFLHISLGNYKINEESKKQIEEKYEKDKLIINLGEETAIQSMETSEKILEGKILNQLLHQIDSSKIPKTIFKINKV